MTDDLRRTPLHGRHVEAGGKMVSFAGFSMPIQYPTGIRAEHRSVRESAGLFDVSHMGEFEVRGEDALPFLLHLAVNDAGRLDEGQAQYSAICTEAGGVLDDLLVYRYPDRYMMVVNGARRTDDWAWVREQSGGFRVEIDDRSEEIALLALQGPSAQEILSPLSDTDLDDIGYYRFAEGRVGGVPGTISRTGYTGEDGFELYVDQGGAVELWDALLDAGSEHGLAPVGLGARDSLRLEMGYALYGSELDLDHTPLEAGLGWITRLDRDVLPVGSEALQRQRREGVGRKLVGLELQEKGFPRPGYTIVREGEAIGTVTSGTVSPTLERGIALGYVPSDASEPGTELGIRIRGEAVPARVRRPPFYQDGSIRR